MTQRSEPRPWTATATAAAAAAVAAAVRGGRSLRWWFRGVLGASAYERYVARHRVEHPDHDPLPEREWWRARQDEATPKGCC
ncbi:MAG TPA: hypothetical protein DHV14_01535 [Micrococcales bacterium]|uniref:YbdD/YjiX family protein n=1 Tax=Miniimonas arenae TaxID=676201 RepID=UPI000EE8F752|nr:YbdD/YjiX family protein [Miniimonas arenae]HCX83825.1 hypothetical protein [Micrococcales bacterium]